MGSRRTCHTLFRYLHTYTHLHVCPDAQWADQEMYGEPCCHQTKTCVTTGYTGFVQMQSRCFFRAFSNLMGMQFCEKNANYILLASLQIYWQPHKLVEEISLEGSGLWACMVTRRRLVEVMGPELSSPFRNSSTNLIFSVHISKDFIMPCRVLL